jgi:hypothetical protein
VGGASPLADQCRRLKSIEPRHIDVQQDNCKLLVQHLLERLFSRASHDDLFPQFIEYRPIDQDLLGQIVHDEDFCLHRTHACSLEFYWWSQARRTDSICSVSTGLDK